MGLAGQYFAKSAIFLGAAALCVPALIALSRIRSDEIDYARARNAGMGKRAANLQRLFDLGKSLQLYVFAVCIFLFQFADASMLPMVSQDLAKTPNKPTSMLLAGLIIAPQVVVALLAPWIGYHSEKFANIIRALLLANFTDYSVLLLAQFFGGISAASLTVLTILVITDLTTGSGRFNLVQGFFGTVIALAASASTGATGFIFERSGRFYGFMILSTAAAAATVLLWAAMKETKPSRYLD